MQIEQKIQEGRSWRHPFKREKWEVIHVGTSKSPERIKLGKNGDVVLYKVGNVTVAGHRKENEVTGREMRLYSATDERINKPQAPWAGHIRYARSELRRIRRYIDRQS